MNLVALGWNNLAGPDLLVIGVIVFFLFGAKQLPKWSKGIAESIRELKSAKNEIDKELKAGVDDVKSLTGDDRRKS